MALSIKGKDLVQQALKKADKRYKDALGAAVYQKGLAILADAVKLTPVDTGRLRASHYATPPEAGVVEIGFGADYALPVHERTEVRHTTGEAKFLQKAVDKHRSGYADWIARQTRANFEADVGPGKVRSGGVPKTADKGWAKGTNKVIRKKAAAVRRAERKAVRKAMRAANRRGQRG